MNLQVTVSVRGAVAINYFIDLMKPKLSIIVVCLNSPDVREACLKALDSQVDSGSVEILAVGHWSSDEQRVNPDDEFGSPGGRFPTVRWLSASKDSTVPQMRTQAILQSHGEIVALLEDDCVVSEDWSSEVVRAHIADHAIIGGAIAPGTYHRRLDWAIYFCEYARFMPPFSGNQNALPGNNVSYKKHALPALNPGDGFYEVFFHEQWRDSGGQLIADQNITVTNVNHWSTRHLTNIPFHHGRAFAGMRSARFSAGRKIVYFLLSPVLPAVKAVRLAAIVYSRRKYRTQFILSLPLIMIFLVSWSIGEFVGYSTGPGQSAGQWR